MEYPINYDSPKELRAYLEGANLGMKKRFGQNFLINKGAREKIVACLPIKKDDIVWEIGPGLGAMTWHLLEKKAKVKAFEIDYGFIVALKDFYAGLENFSIIEGDFIKIFRQMLKQEKQQLDSPSYILSNLPYSSGSVMIAEIIKSFVNPEKMVFTVQKEVGQRMVAVPGDKDYSGFSLVCQSKYQVTLKGELNSGSFFPPPAVKSVIVELRKIKTFDESLSKVYYDLIGDLFRSRRKTVLNNLIGGKLVQEYGKQHILSALSKNSIDFNRRPETLGIEDVEKISKSIINLV